MPSSIGVNLRVTGHCSQGARKYMEDMFSVAYQRTEDERDLEYAFFGIFDGHGGQQAATFAKEHLLDNIVSQKCFWSNKDREVLRAIREGFLQTHLAMWRQLDHWPKTPVGLPSTSGTTASIAFIRRGKIYIGHVGDSSIVLGYRDEDGKWKGIPLTRDHKPESEEETQRIEQSGGKVMKKSGVSRVVWNRPRLGHQGPVRRSTHIDEIPFLAIARSLGDLWSYNPAQDVFVVSPEPDVTVHTIEDSHRCLIFGTDGLWNVMSPNSAVEVVQAVEARNEQHLLQQGTDSSNGVPHTWVNPSKRLVDRALEEWQALRMLADNTSVVTLMLDPPGPPRVQVLLSQRQQPQVLEISNVSTATSAKSLVDSPIETASKYQSPEDITPGGVSIYTRVCNPLSLPDSSSGNMCSSPASQAPLPSPPMSLVCLQSNEVSSSSCAAPTFPQTSCSVKTINTSVNRGKSLLAPVLETDVSKPSFKRRHSSGITQAMTSATEKRKRTRSEHDCLSKESIKDEDLGASDAENDRVTWPPWSAVQKPTSTKLLQLSAESKVAGSRSGKSMLPLFPAAPENANSHCPHSLRSVSSIGPPKWTLRSRNAPVEPHAKVEKDSESSDHVILLRSGHLSSAHRPHRHSWPRTPQPMAMRTRSKGREHSPHNK